MKKTEKIRRFIPCSLFNISKLEDWLEDMAADGCILQSLSNSGIATFIKTEPKIIHYRVWPKNKFSDEGDVKRLRESYGFVRIDENTNLDIYITDSNTSNHIDNDEDAERFHKKAIKHQRYLCIFDLISALAAIAFYFFIKPFFLTAVTFGWAFSILPVLLILFTAIKGLIKLINIGKLKNPSTKPDINEKNNWQAASILNTVLNISEKAFVIILIPLLIGWDYNVHIDSHISSCNEELPFATVKDLFPDAEYQERTRSDRNVYNNWSLFFAPVNYEWNEDAILTFSDGSVYRCHLRVNYHETASPFMAKAVAREYIRKDNSLFSRLDIRDLPQLDADYAVFYSYITNTIVIQNDNKIIKSDYFLSSETDKEIPDDEIIRTIYEHFS